MAKTGSEVSSQTESRTSPVVTFRHRSISASVFQNDGSGDNTYFSVSVQKRFRDKENGTWKNSSNFLRDELPVLEHLVRQAFAYVLEQESAPAAQKTE